MTPFPEDSEKVRYSTCIRFTLLLTLLASGMSGTAQERSLNIRSYDIREGLSHRNVQCIHQDRRGFIWLGTDNGLNRFDGYHFKWFFKENGLASSEVNHILEDKNGQLWLFDTGYFVEHKVNTLTIFNPDTYVFQSLEEKFGTNLPFSATDILMFGYDEKGDLVFITNKRQRAVYTGEWDITNLALLNNSENTLQSDLPAEATFELSDPIFQETSSLSQSDYDSLYKQKMAETATHFWIIIKRRLLIVVDKTTRRILPLGQQYPAFKNTNCLFVDKNQTVWAGTIFGLYQIDFKQSLFKIYLQNEAAQRDGDVVVCRQITGDNADRLWVRVENPNAIWEITLSDNTSFDISRGNGFFAPLPYTPTENNKAVLFASDHTLLYPDKGDLIRANLLTRQYQRYFTQQPERIVWNLQEDRTSTIWFSDKTTNEIGFLKEGKCTILPQKPVDNGFLYVYQFLQLPHADSLWLATNQGLFLLNNRTGVISSHFWSGGQGREHFPFDNIHHLYADPDGSYWAATAVDGMVHFAAGSDGLKVIRRYTRTDGLSNNAVYAIYGDEYENLWLSTDYGINQFNKKTGRFRSYTVEDGVSSNEFNRGSHFQDRTGRIYFGSMKGVTAFHPRDFTGDALQESPAMVISSFEQFDNRTNTLSDKLGEILQTNTITVRPDALYFLLEFALLTFQETDKTQFAYMVEGVDRQWNYQRENFIRLSRLPFGTYTLRVKGQDAGGKWSDKELAIRLLVLKPFYLQTWFLLTISISLFVAAFVFYKWRIRSLQAQRDQLERVVAERTWELSRDKKIIEQQKEELQSLEQLKSRFFANVSHELRTPLTLLLGPVSSLLKRNEHAGGDTTQLLHFIERNARHLQKLINEILDLSKLEDNKMQVTEEPVLVFAYLREQMAQFQSIAQSNNLHFELQFSADPGLRILLDKGKFEKILHNFCSNALKFTPQGGRISISFEGMERHLLLRVTDTGRGIHPDDLPHVFDRFYQSRQPDAPIEGGTGIGLALVKELAELLGGAVGVESEPGRGSMFWFRFPKKEAPADLETAGSDESRQPIIKTPIPVLPEKINATSDSSEKATDLPSILIVEDNADLLQYLQLLLAEYQVIPAENGQDALNILGMRRHNGQPTDLIISDLMMPVMDGFQLLERLKTDDRWRHVPVIMLTAKVNVQAHLQALRIGVDDYITKPFGEDELKARIHNLLRNYRERMAFFSGTTAANAPPDNDSLPVIAQVDSEWLKDVEIVFSKILADRNFNLEWVASQLHLSSRQVSRKLQKIVGLSPHQYLQEMRLQTAREYLANGRFATIKETGFAVGFRDTEYFSELFSERFGTTPSAFKA